MTNIGLDQIVFAVLNGSHSIGTAVDSSDVDIRGVFIPSQADSSVRRQLEVMCDFLEIAKPGCVEIAAIESMIGRKLKDGEKIDAVMIELGHFVTMMYNGQGIVIDMLHVDPEFRVVTTELSELMLADDNASLTPWIRMHYYGYALFRTRILRAFQEAYHGRLSPPPRPTRESFGLPQAYSLSAVEAEEATARLTAALHTWLSDPGALPSNIQDRKFFPLIVETWHTTTTAESRVMIPPSTQPSTERLGAAPAAFHESGYGDLARAALPGYDSDLVDRFAREWYWRVAINTCWWAEQSFESFRRPANLHKRWLHIVRRARISREIMNGKEFRMYRDDAGALLDIRMGKWTFAQVMDEIAKCSAEIGDMYFAGILPKIRRPDHRDRDGLVNRLLQMAARQGMVYV